MATPRISFITALYNCVDLSREMLRTLEETVDLSQHEVILIDDASSDGTSELLSEFEGRFTILRNETNQGFAASNNRAAQQATGDILAFLNNDLILKESWLEPMLETLESEANIGIVGNIQIDANRGWIDHAGIFFDLEGLPTHAWKTRKAPPKEAVTERSAVTAACMLIRRELFHEFGGFDELYQNGLEDVDLCVRLKDAGYRHFVANRSVILHHISQAPNRHLRNEANTQRFRKLRAQTAKRYGEKEWPKEYLSRYKRLWWKLGPLKTAKALIMLARGNG